MKGWQDARSILAVRLDNAGDVIMLGPALRAVKESDPRIAITLLATPGGAQAAKLLPWVNEVMVWRPIWQDVGGRMTFEPEHERALIRELARRRFDGALIFTSFSQTPHVPGYVCGLAGIPLRAGASKEFGGGTLTLELRDLPDEMHQVDRNLALVEAAGYQATDQGPAIAIAGPDRAVIDEIGLDRTCPLVLVHPGASAEARRYPAERFGDAARLLRERGYQVVVTGTDREAEAVETVLRRAPGAIGAPLNLRMGQLAALISNADCVVCNNSLPLHLSDATGTPLVVLYAGTELESQWRPRRSAARLLRVETSCHPCYRFTCPIGKPCLDIAPAEVVEAVEAVTRRAVTQPARAGASGREPEPRRIAIFRALHLGDLLLAVPALRRLRALFPKAEITLIGLPWAAEIARRFPRYLDRFREFPGFPGIAERAYDETRTAGFIEDQRGHYDLAIQLHGSGATSNAFVHMLGAGVTAGYVPGPDSEARPDIALVYRDEGHEISRNLALVEAIGGRWGAGEDRGPALTTEERRLEFPLGPEDLAEADRLLPAGGGPLAVIHPGSRSPERRWPTERFTELAARLREREATVVIVGGADDAAAAGRITAGSGAANIAGMTSLGGLAAVISTADLFIGNDSGPSHLAEAVNTPSVVLFGSEEPERWGPVDGERHRVIRRPDATGGWSMEAIPVEDVLEAAGTLMASHGYVRSEVAGSGAGAPVALEVAGWSA